MRIWQPLNLRRTGRTKAMLTAAIEHANRADTHVSIIIGASRRHCDALLAQLREYPDGPVATGRIYFISASERHGFFGKNWLGREVMFFVDHHAQDRIVEDRITSMGA